MICQLAFHPVCCNMLYFFFLNINVSVAYKFFYYLFHSLGLNMSGIDLTARYTLTNELLGSSRTLASTKLNDSLIVVSSSFDSSQSWYFTATSESDYYYLHTVQKGDFNVLDVDHYYGRNSIDMHFYYIQPERTGQYWRLSQQDDGSVKISNNFTGPDMFLDIDKASLRPMLKAQDSPGQRWTLSNQESTPMATSITKMALPTTAISMTTSISAFTTELSSTCTADCSVTKTPSPPLSRLSTGSIAGIAVGCAAMLGLLIGALMYWRHSRKNRGFEAVAMQSGPMWSRPVLHG